MNLETTAQNGMNQKILRKGDEIYIFRYAPGSEQMLLATVHEYAERPDINFDLFDASIISFSLVQDIIAQNP